MLESDLGDEWLGLGVVKVVERRADNRVVLDDRYIPPWLAAGGHPLLLGFVQELYGLLNTRSEALAMRLRSEEHTSELQSLMRISYAVFCLKKKNKTTTQP